MKRYLMAATALSVIAAAGVASAETLKFEPVPVPVTDAAKREVVASKTVTVAGKTYPIGYNVLARTGDKIGGGVFGAIIDANGKPTVNQDGFENSVDTDFTSLLPVGDKLYSVTHFESRPGGLYLTELNQDKATGKLTPVSTRPIDMSSVGGLWVPCAGSVTPWNTHLGSEEYPPDARAIVDAKSYEEIDDYWKPFVTYFGLDPKTATLDQYRTAFNPYQYGYAVEVKVGADGSTNVDKHYAMGRSAFELAYVMPDRKTVYYSDDGTNVGFYMFIADVPGHLTAGSLYALKWHQKSAENGGRADVTWVPLGHADYDTIAKAVKDKVTFYDMFDAEKGTKEGTCPAGFGSINTTDGFECLKVKPGMETIASRLETRRYAALMGATTEIRKEEGITFNPDANVLYVAASAVERGMEDFAKNGKKSDKYDLGGPNDMKLASNKCGTVFGLDVGPNAAIGSDYVAYNMYGVVSGTEKSYPKDGDYANNKCDLDGIANPDNLTYLPGYDTLIIGEDTGSGHQNDFIWSYNVKSGELTRIETTPYGSETTSPYWYPNINGWGYLISVVQHPYGESDQKMLKDPADARAYVGYVGPFPALN